MSSQVVVYLGPAGSGKTEALVRQYRDSLRAAGQFGRSLWLAPTERAAALVRQRLVSSGLDACLDPGVLTFDGLATRILDASRVSVRRLRPAMQRQLLRRLVCSAQDQGELVFYAGAADRAGFVDLLLEHIRELKRRDIRPHAFSRARPPQGDALQHRDLAQLYADYQRELTTHGLVDAESALWAAHDALARHTAAALDSLDLVVVDGFTDFTHTQHEILALIARGAKQLIIALQSDAEPSFAQGPPLPPGEGRESAHRRPDLFAKTTATLAELRRYHPKLAERWFAPQPSGWPAHDHLMRNLFRHPQHLPAPSPEVLESLGRMEIIEAAGTQDEIVQIARRIKRLLTQSPLPIREAPGERSLAAYAARPDDIVVVFRSLAEPAARVREVFDEFGIPYSLESGEPLSTTALCKTLLALMRLDDEDWPFRRVVSTLTNNSLTAIDALARRAVDWLVRDIQVAEGRRALVERVEQLAGDKSPPGTLAEYAQRRVDRAKIALPAIRLLAAALDSLPVEATATQWCNALAQLGSQLGVSPFGSRSDNPIRQSIQDDGQNCPSYQSSDALAWQSIVEHFESLERLDAWLGLPPRMMPRRDVLAALVDAARHGSLPRLNNDVGRVRVLSAPKARTIRAKHLFVAGMSEQAFPAPERAGRLCTESQYRFFARAANQRSSTHAPQSPPPATRSQEEMLLFYGVAACAEESLTISYPALDDKAQQLPASPYVTEIRRTLGVDEQVHLAVAGPQLSPIPPGDTPFGPSDWRIQSVAKAMTGDVRLLAGLLNILPLPRGEGFKIGSAIDAGLRTVHARARRESFGPAEGLLTSPAVAARLAARFGPQHLWSPSQWETYAACPHKFFLESILGLEPLGDLVLETDFARRGSRLHDVLAEFHRHWPSARRERSIGPEQEAAAFADHLRKVVNERVAAPRAGIDAALLELDRRQILKWAEHHFEHDARYQAQWPELAATLEPAHFELRFGPKRPGDEDVEDPHSCHDAFALEIDGESVLVTGRIDRIDVARVGGRVVFNVIDYKSGRKSSLKEEHIASGEHLQLPIYVEAAQALVFGGNAEPLAAGYWTMSGGFDTKGVLSVQQGEDGEERRKRIWAAVQARIGEFITAIRRGDFPVFSRDDKCTSRCDFNTVCRIAQIRSLGKSWPPDEQVRRDCLAAPRDSTELAEVSEPPASGAKRVGESAPGNPALRSAGAPCRG